MERQRTHNMLRARAFEERAAEEYSKGSFAGFLHLYPGALLIYRQLRV